MLFVGTKFGNVENSAPSWDTFSRHCTNIILYSEHKMYAWRIISFLEKNDCLGCVAELTGTIIACALEWETGVGIAACVAQVVGTANGCYPCICWVMETLGYSC